jgi:CRP/FNR family transcriptional regulator
LNLEKRHSREDEEVNQFNFPMSRMDISDYLGLTIETVSRTLTSFSKDGLIILEGRKSVEILKRDDMEELASGNQD